MCFSLFSPKRSSNPSKSTTKSRSKSTSGRAAMANTPRTSIGKKQDAYDHYRNSSSMEFNLNSTSTASSSFSGHHYKLSPRSSTIGAGRSPRSLSSLRDSLSENPHIYSFSQIRSATANFMSKPLHQSSSSTSWRSSIDGKDVIVTQRRLRRPIDAAELRDKITRICRSHHTALVRLHGASVSGNSVYLVHERVEGASLSDCLRNPRNPNFTVLSNWLSRVQIATDIAEAVDYLHNFSGMKVGFVHNHIKSSSIIVKEPMLNGKLCHLGTAQLCGELVETAADESDEKEIKQVGDQSTKELKRSLSGGMKFEGTRGYMSPEFQTTGIATRESDVYAFGVVLLEILSGDEPMKIILDEETGVFRKVSLIEAAREVVAGGDGGGKLRKWVDCRLKDSFPVEVVGRMSRLAVECVQEDPNKRPDMGRVAGIISKLYLDSKSWAETIGVPTDFSVTLGPR